MLIFKIGGTVTVAETLAPLPGLLVKAYDADFLFDDLMGSALVGADGRFELVCQGRDFRDFFERRPDIYLRVLAPDGARELISTENAVRWNAGRVERFDIRISLTKLGDLARTPRVSFVDDRGEPRQDYDPGESLSVALAGLAPARAHDIVLSDERGVLFESRLLSDVTGSIEPTTLWPQAGLDDPRSGAKLSLEAARARWGGREVALEVRADGHVLARESLRFAAELERPLLLAVDDDDRVLNGFEHGKHALIVAAENVPFEGKARVFVVSRRHAWKPGDRFEPVTEGERSLFADVSVPPGARRFRVRLAEPGALRPGAYDFVVRRLRYGYEDDEDFVLRATDLVTSLDTGVVIRQDFMGSKVVKGGCVNRLPISGRPVFGAPYFRYSDVFQVGEPVYAALDPAALDPTLASKMVALHLIAHKPESAWATDNSLTHLAALGGNPAVPILKVQSGCINFNKVLLWPSAAAGEYDVVADFGNNSADAATFVADHAFDAPLDIIDGYFTSGFRVVPDPGTDTTFAHVGSLSYDQTTQGTVFVLNDLGIHTTVERRAVVRFPADIAGATAPSQISAALASYPLIVVAHGIGHDYQGYNYLLDHWAANGFIAASIYLITFYDGDVMTGSDRAQVLLSHIAILKSLFGTTLANNIGILGHSRGGEGVAIAPRLNHEQGLGHGINAVLSVAPTNQYKNESISGAWATPYCVVYGALDGDVDGTVSISPSPSYLAGFPLGNCGFALYDKAQGREKSMIFVHGACHDRFTTIGSDVDVSWLEASDIPKLLSATAHQTLLRAYSTAFFRWQLKAETQWKGMFQGEWVPTSVQDADAGAVKLYTQFEEPSATVVDDFEGTHTSTSWQTGALGSVDDAGTLPADPAEGALFALDAHSPHTTSGLLLRWNDASDHLDYDFAPRDVSAASVLSFRIGQRVNSASNPAGLALNLFVRLTDGGGHSRAINVGRFFEIPYPQERGDDTLTKSAMRSVRLPLTAYTIEVIGTQRVDLTNVTKLTFEFSAQVKGEVALDNVTFGA